MADELNIPTHRYYQPRNNIKLAKGDFSKQWIYDSGIQKIDAWINSQPWGNPVSQLFALNEPGVWYDPSDLTTLFQDPAGTTPVTAPGNTVGLMLDKSKGLVLGSELVTNGTFDTNIANWTPFNSGTASWDAQTFKLVNSSFSGATQVISCTVGKTYKVQASLKGFVPWVRVGFSEGAAQMGSSPAVIYADWTTVTFIFTALSSAPFLTIGIGNAGAGTAFFDNISVRELAGNHATQATIAARPTYSIEPVGGRRNQLTFSEDLTNAVWVTGTTAGTFTKGSVSTDRPDGTTGTVSTLAFPAVNSSQFCIAAQSSGSSYLNVLVTCSVWLRVTSGTAPIYISVEDAAAGPSAGNFFTSPALTLTTTWQRFTLTGTRTSTTGNASAVIGFDTRAAAGQTNAAPLTVQVFGAQLEQSATATPYQKVTTQYDVTEAGVPSCSYLFFDGGSDSMATGNIDFTATDKMSVFAGVRRLSDAAGVIAELSTNWNTSTGSFLFWGGTSMTSGLGNGFNSGSRGNATASAAQAGISPATFTPPVSAVLAVVHDIAGDLSSVRGNGIVGTDSTVDKGTGNFSNQPLYIGARAGTSLFFNGNLFGLVVRGAASTTAQITATEAWLAPKTGVVLP
jgi:hypothetical protein